jgi:hypothetical protein
MSNIDSIPFYADNRRFFWLVCLLVGIASAIRVVFLLLDAFPFNADEAIVALMGRHILAGNGVPLFFYGQSYMGSLDALLVAFGFYLFGEQVWVIRIIQILLYAGFMLTSIWLAQRLSKSRKIALLIGVLLAFPTVNIFLYTTVSLGGYGEAMLIGNIILILAHIIVTEESATGRYLLWFSLGFLVGFGFWVFGLTLVFGLASTVYLLIHTIFKRGSSHFRQDIKQWALYGLGAVIGLTPIIAAAIRSGLGVIIQEATGSAISSAAQGTFLEQIGMRIVSFVLLGIPVITGIRPPWEVGWFLLPALPFVLVFWFAAVYLFVNKKHRLRYRLDDGGVLLLLVIWVNIGGFLLTTFGSDPSGRYFLPLVLPLSIIGSLLIEFMATRWRHWFWLLPLLLCSYNLFGIVVSAQRQPPGLTTQIDAVAQVNHRYMPELIDFLSQKKLQAGYANYWVAYPLAFLSQERLIYVPALPYHHDFRFTTRDNRYRAYDSIVAQAGNIAYITTNHEPLNAYLREQFDRQQVSWVEKNIGDYHIFYELSRDIRPQEIGLGENR